MRKKIYAEAAALLLLGFLLTACGKAPAEETTAIEDTLTVQTEETAAAENTTAEADAETAPVGTSAAKTTAAAITTTRAPEETSAAKTTSAQTTDDGGGKDKKTDKPQSKTEKKDRDNPVKGLISEKTLKEVRKIYGAANTGPQKVTTVHQLATLTSICSATKCAGPIAVTPAQLNGESITLLTLGGTEFKPGQATTIDESKLASFGKTNDYLKAVIKLIKDGTIPAGKPLVAVGISLGGMIAQQLLGEQELLASENIELRAVITFGSPLTPPLDRHGVQVVRFADKHDMVPKVGEISVYRELGKAESRAKKLKEIKELNESETVVGNGKHFSPIDAHALSYISDPCWKPYDFLGSRQKENVLVLKKAMTFYPAPKISGK